MPDRVKGVIDPMKARWDLLTTQQRYKLIGVIAVVLLALILTAYFAFRTSWETIQSNSNAQELNPMRVQLENAGIRNRTRVHGSVLQVDARHAERAMGVIIEGGAVPNNDHFTWEDALDTGLGTTDSERRRMDILGREGAIERQLIMFNGVQQAVVTLDIPTTRPFDRNPPLPTAAVMLTVTQDFSRADGRNMARIVAANASGLIVENVTIMDQWMRPIFMGDDEINDLADQTEQIRMQYRNFQTESLRRMLGMTFDEIYVVPNFVWDERQMSEEIITRFTAPEGMEGTGIASQHVASRAQMEGSPSGWEPGLQNNAAAMPNYLMPGGGIMSASQSEFARNYFVDSSVLEIITGSGGVIPERSTVAATATWNRNLRQVDWINATPEGEDPRTNDDWEVFKNENSNPRRLNGDLDAYALAEFHELVASAMGVPIDNVTLHIQERLIFIDTEHVPLELATILMVIVLLLLLAMLLYGLLRKQRAAGEDEEALEPQLAVEDLLVSTQLEEAREEETQQLEEIDYFKENEVKRHIEKFVNEKPEAVAALLRNWINVEEW